MVSTPVSGFKIWVLYLLHSILLACAAVVFFAAFRLEPTEGQCDRHTGSWSPALPFVKYHWETFDFSDHEFVSSKPSPYFGFKASDAIESAWNELLPKHPIAIPSSRLGDLGHAATSNESAWVTDPLDRDSILALPEYSVQLGCLNLLRQLGHRSSRDFSNLAAFQGGESLVWLRAYQCLDRLRQAIMCWGDLGSIPSYHRRNTGSHEDDTAFDFGTLQYCRNFDDMVEWTARNGIKRVTLNNLWWGGSEDVLWTSS